MEADRTELHDLAAQHPDRVARHGGAVRRVGGALRRDPARQDRRADEAARASRARSGRRTSSGDGPRRCKRAGRRARARRNGARHCPKGQRKNRNSPTRLSRAGTYAALQQATRRSAMSVDQLFGKYRRLKKDLSAAYSQPQWNAALVDRLVDEIGQVERELALQAPAAPARACEPTEEGRAAVGASARACAGARARLRPPWRRDR